MSSISRDPRDPPACPKVAGFQMQFGISTSPKITKNQCQINGFQLPIWRSSRSKIGIPYNTVRSGRTKNHPKNGWPQRVILAYSRARLSDFMHFWPKHGAMAIWPSRPAIVQNDEEIVKSCLVIGPNRPKINKFKEIYRNLQKFQEIQTNSKKFKDVWNTSSCCFYLWWLTGTRKKGKLTRQD